MPRASHIKKTTHVRVDPRFAALLMDWSRRRKISLVTLSRSLAVVLRSPDVRDPILIRLVALHHRDREE